MTGWSAVYPERYSALDCQSRMSMEGRPARGPQSLSLSLPCLRTMDRRIREAVSVLRLTAQQELQLRGVELCQVLEGQHTVEPIGQLQIARPHPPIQAQIHNNNNNKQGRD